ncbi:MAG TPA: hypothetical protein VGN14_05235, partial [Candidatus Elarobacter sp.]
MARSGRALAAAALVLAALAVAVPSRAQSLRTLHVDALTMRADHARVDVGQTFHLAIEVRVRERVAALDELVIPDVGTMQILGDERRVTAGPAGTTVVETLTLQSSLAGTYTFAPAYLDAVDAKTHKPSRFSSNPVRVVVGIPGVASAYGLGGLLAAAKWLALAAVAIVAVIAVIVATIVAVSIVRSRVPQPVRAAVRAPAPIMTPPPAARTPRDAVADALRAYRTSPADGALLGLRGALFTAAGSTPGATLRDALATVSDQTLRAALVAAERAAFGPAIQR